MELDKFKLLCIDMQNDFISGSLAVPGAQQDANNVADLIKRKGDSIDSIYFTIDTHPLNHIGHPGYWKMKDGSNPAPFTFITEKDLLDGSITTSDEANSQYAIKYVSSLGGSVVWPVHCVDGTEGWLIDANLEATAFEWKEATKGYLKAVKKGYDPNLEYFGVFAPEYDGEHHFNEDLALELLADGAPIVVVGEAKSHCVGRSVEQLIQYIKDKDVSYSLKNIILLEDCMSNVTGFEKSGDTFFSEFTKAGVTITMSTDLK